MKLTPGRIGCAILALYVLSLLGGDPQDAEYRARDRQARAMVTDSRRQERDSLKLSSVALDRFRRGCQPVIDQKTGLEVIHGTDITFIDSRTGFALPEGTEVCNSLAWTAVIQADGTASDVAIATPQDSNNNQVPDNIEAEEIFKAYD